MSNVQTKSGLQIRQEFIDFFVETHSHANVVSSSLLPADDPTLLFANAGMNQFKPIFLGTETRDYTRAANTQKCIRAGGKHNDLEDVGRDCYHHTFFEMLGNWSFGDYFKTEAIDWAWDLLTNVWGLAPERLHATYFEGDAGDGLEADTEARDLWRKYLPDARIHTGNKKDNFWEMGETGPCGPCSEIHYDATEDLSGGPLVNADSPLVIEIWNLVFIQFNRDATGALEPLPAQHVDTGMGLERVTKIIQGKKSNYASDLFVPILEAIEELSGKTYGAQAADGADRYDVMDDDDLVDVAMRVIADHARTLTFGIADGILPGNAGRGAVLRAILRRAAGFGRQHLQIQGTFLHKLVGVIVEHFAGAFPELASRKEYVTGVILDEENAFAQTLDRGLQLLECQIEQHRTQGATTISGETCFELHATFGFPFTLTKLIAEKAGLGVDEAGFDDAMQAHQAASRGEGDTFKAAQIIGLPPTDDSGKYAVTRLDTSESELLEARVLGWVIEGKFVTEGELTEGDEVAVILDATQFYGESGGQHGDRGTLLSPRGVFTVEDTKVAGQAVLHVGRMRHGTLAIGAAVRGQVCECRMDVMRNHTATHLLNYALREVLGEEIHQAGSVVECSRLRFDFTNNAAVTADQLAHVERIVNEIILANRAVETCVMDLDEAKQLPGVRAVFGEKYGQEVRVVSVAGGKVGEEIIEFCGGTHVGSTGGIGLFKIVSEESVAKGIRRIVAVTGNEAVKEIQLCDEILKSAAALLRVSPGDVPARIEALQVEIKKLKKRPTGGGASSLANEVSFETSAGKVVIARFGVMDPGAMRNQCDQLRQQGAAAVFLAAADEDAGKVMLIAMVSDETVKAAGFKAGDWVKHTAPVVGGGGGGKPTLAQAGGKQPEKLNDALDAAAAFAKEALA